MNLGSPFDIVDELLLTTLGKSLNYSGRAEANTEVTVYLLLTKCLVTGIGYLFSKYIAAQSFYCFTNLRRNSVTTTNYIAIDRYGYL